MPPKKSRGTWLPLLPASTCMTRCAALVVCVCACVCVVAAVVWGLQTIHLNPIQCCVVMQGCLWCGCWWLFGLVCDMVKSSTLVIALVDLTHV